jgi:uncharacterized membrane protein YkvA (DUF1232 family)
LIELIPAVPQGTAGFLLSEGQTAFAAKLPFSDSLSFLCRVSTDKAKILTLLDNWKKQARLLKREAYALYLACRDPRVPWHARILTACVTGYAFSPIDLIPDFIPILGYLDDLILVPLGIAIVLRMIPPIVMTECRTRAEALIKEGKPVSRTAAVVILIIWLLCAALVAGYVVE